MAYMFSNIILFGGLIASLGVGGINANQQQEENHQIKLENHKGVSYDDSNYKITLSADELNNYTWDNLTNYINDIKPSSGTLVISKADYNTDLDLSVTAYADSQFIINIGHPNPSIKFNSSTALKSFIYSGGDFEYSLVFDFSNYTSYYDDFKQAIELDIQANTQGNMPSAQDLFAQITAGVTGFVGSLGQAFTSVVALFWDSTNSTPTFVGLLMLLAIGAGLIYLAIRFVMGLVRRLRG